MKKKLAGGRWGLGVGWGGVCNALNFFFDKLKGRGHLYRSRHRWQNNVKTIVEETRNRILSDMPHSV